MSPDHGTDSAHSAGFPRVSGDEPSVKSVVAKPIKFSPRERG